MSPPPASFRKSLSRGAAAAMTKYVPFLSNSSKFKLVKNAPLLAMLHILLDIINVGMGSRCLHFLPVNMYQMSGRQKKTNVKICLIDIVYISTHVQHREDHHGRMPHIVDVTMNDELLSFISSNNYTK
jgi:hypothetical protein